MSEVINEVYNNLIRKGSDFETCLNKLLSTIKKDLDCDVFIISNIRDSYIIQFSLDKQFEHLKNIEDIISKTSNKLVKIKDEYFYSIKLNTKNEYHMVLSRKKEKFKAEDINDLKLIINTIENALEFKSIRKWINLIDKVNIDNYGFLVNSINHVLKTPLNGILGMIELLSKSELNQTQKNYLKVTYTCCYELLYIVNNLLDFVNIFTDNIIISKDRVNIKKCIQDCIGFMDVHAKETSVTVILDDKEDDNLIIDTDYKRIKQIILNILSNAIKYSPKGNVLITVNYINHILHISIADDGIGISEERLKHIFEPFNRLLKYNDDDGVGLGLTISYHLIKKMGGDINVKSKLGDGSTFIFSLPIKESDNFVVDPNILVNKRVLIVDDTTTDRIKLYKLIVKLKGIPTICSSTEEALFHLDVTKFDVVIIDPIMKPISGYELAKQTKNKFKKIRLIGTKIDEQINKLDKECFDDVIIKPVTEKGLVNSVCKILKIKTKIKVSKIKPIKVTKDDIKILYAEDSAMNRDVTSGFLKNMGYTNLETVENGSYVLNKIKKKFYDIIMLDIKMPEMDGYETTKLLKKHYEKCSEKSYIIAVTAIASDINREYCRKIGMDEFISKPIIYHEFETLINSLYDQIKRNKEFEKN